MLRIDREFQWQNTLTTCLPAHSKWTGQNLLDQVLRWKNGVFCLSPYVSRKFRPLPPTDTTNYCFYVARTVRGTHYVQKQMLCSITKHTLGGRVQQRAEQTTHLHQLDFTNTSFECSRSQRRLKPLAPTESACNTYLPAQL